MISGPKGKIAADSTANDKSEQAFVVFTPSGKRGTVPIGTSILNAARILKVDLDSVCGGRAMCGRCQVTPVFGSFAKHKINSKKTSLSQPREAELHYAQKRTLKSERRLGCNAEILKDVVIDVPKESQIHRQVIRKDAEPVKTELRPSVKLYKLKVREPSIEEPKSDLRRVKDSIAEQHPSTNNGDPITCDLKVLQKIQPVLREGNWEITVALTYDRQIVGIWPGTKTKIYGLAVDIGSTTMSAQLCDLITGKVVAASGTMNPQIRFGEDLMSRVSHLMMNPDANTALTQAVRESVNFLASETTADLGLQADEILDLVFVGNPIMHHIFLGIDPTELGGAPFALSTDEALNLNATEIDLYVHPAAKVYFLPCIAGHVGADTAAVVLSSNPFLAEEMTLIIDIGTNAEIILGNQDRVMACSSPTGPAFEGAQISSGQRAAAGAIERIRIDKKTLEPIFRVIGTEEWSDDPAFKVSVKKVGVSGICGSGIIEAIAEMFLVGIITDDGFIDGKLSAKTHRVKEDGRTFSYRISDEVVITQNDIRSIQLAKAALYAGCQLLMDRMNVNKVDKILLAGAFGTYISPKHALIIGMLPDCKLSNVTSIGNAAGTGARIALLDHTSRSSIETVVRRIEKIETAVEPDFQQYFVEAMAIPHKTAPFNELRSIVDLPKINPEDTPKYNRTRRRSKKR